MNELNVGDRFTDEHGEVRVIALAEGWVMVRRKNAVPFVAYWKEFTSDGKWKPVPIRERTQA